MECTCKFYEPDMEAKEEAEKMYAFYQTAFPEIELADEPEQIEPPAEDDPLASCGAFCRYLKSGKGYPGEYVYYCCAAGNEHIIHVDFNESEII